MTNNLLGALKMNWTVWPAVQAVNLTMVPLAHRVTVVNLVCIPWTGGRRATPAPARRSAARLAGAPDAD